MIWMESACDPFSRTATTGNLPHVTPVIFHFPAHYTVPITAFRSGDFKLMRHLNSGELKLFNVVKDMGETNDLTKKMPEKTTEMVRQLDAYLLEVGAWTMEEVYATRLEELEKWTFENQLKVDQLNQQLNETGLSQEDRLGIQEVEGKHDKNKAL